MSGNYTSEQLWKLYKNLPEELKEAVFSMETTNSIYDICARNEIEKVKELAKLVGYVLIGVLPPDEFQENIKKELKLKEEKAKSVAQETYRFIFYPVKPLLEEIYKIELKPAVGLKKTTAEKLGATPRSKKESSALPKEDIYREPIEEE